MDRCYNENSQGYSTYGAIGVCVAEEWIEDPEEFVDWCLSNGYKSGLDLDKDKLCSIANIEPKIYSPKTCMFIDRTENARFRVRIPGRKGIGIDKISEKSFRARITVDKVRIVIGKFNTIEDAINGRNNYIVENKLSFPLEKI